MVCIVLEMGFVSCIKKMISLNMHAYVFHCDTQQTQTLKGQHMGIGLIAFVELYLLVISAR